MDVVSHPAVCMDTLSVALQPFSQSCFPAMPVAVVEENWLPVIATKNDVVQAAGYVQARFAWHRASRRSME